MQPKLAANIKSGFRTSGIVPLDRSQVLKKIPSCDITDVSVSTVFNSTLVSLLEENRSSANTKKRGKKVVHNVLPGQPVLPGNFSVDDAVDAVYNHHDHHHLKNFAREQNSTDVS